MEFINKIKAILKDSGYRKVKIKHRKIYKAELKNNENLKGFKIEILILK